MKINKKHAFLMLFVYVLMLFSYAVAFAQSEDADAGNKPLNFLSATYNAGTSLQDAIEVPLNPQFIMEFDKNVVNDSVWNTNVSCFSLQSESNEIVPINVTRVDDKVDFNQRQKVFIQPTQALKAGTTYYLKASPNLRAKNGNSTLSGTTLGQGVTITFKTAGQAAVNQDTSSTTTTSGTTSSASTSTSTSTDSGVSSISKATVFLTRITTLLQSVLYLQNSVAQFKLPLG